jgi:hypothetical protein
MFNAWKQEKATVALIDAAQDVADRLSSAKPHIRDAHAAAAWFWQVAFRAEGKDLHRLAEWPPANVARFATAAQSRIAILRKARAYDSSDGLAIWLHTAHAITEPRIAPAVRDIWQQLLAAGPNADAMAQDMIADADFWSGSERPALPERQAPVGFADNT